jgi:tripeptide aminopeptidase
MTSAKIKKNQQIIDTFIDLVKISSPSHHEQNVAKYLIKTFKKLGYKTRVDAKGNLHIIIPGVLANGPTLLFNAHMDTVVPGNNVKPQIKKDRIVSDGKTVLGADDKAGIAAIIEMVRQLKEKKVLFKELKIIFTVEEEIGLQGAKQLAFDDVQADYCFVLDSDGDVGSVVIKAPAQDILEIKVTGRSAHAGLNPEKGISAIKIAAAAIAKIDNGKIDNETTANVGIIRGGRATNIIADEVYVKAEARSHDEDKLSRQVRQMTDAFKNAAEKFGGAVEIKVRRSYNKVAMSKDADIVKVTKLAAKKLKLPCQVKMSGGGSDASIIYGYGIPTVALCIGMEQVHSCQEYIKIENLAKLPNFLIELIKMAQQYERSRN